VSPGNRKATIAIAVILFLGGFGMYLRGHAAVPERPADFSRIPMEADGYVGTEHRFEEYTYDILKADTTTLRLYHSQNGEPFWLFVAYFSSQKYGGQIHSPIHCVPGGGYKIVSIEPYLLDLGQAGQLPVRRLLIANQNHREVMLYWFETRSGVIANEYALKLNLMKSSVLLMPTDAAICRVTTPLSGPTDFQAATDRAASFIRAFYPTMRTALPFQDLSK